MACKQEIDAYSLVAGRLWLWQHAEGIQNSLKKEMVMASNKQQNAIKSTE